MDLEKVIEKAAAAVHAAYIEACDDAGAALDPVDLGLPGWACELLADAFEARLDQE